MTGFLIKSTVCSGLLLAVYLLLLEREKMPVFNRFFLLFSLCFSLALPFITIEIASETAPVFNAFAPIQTVGTPIGSPIVPEATFNYLPFVLLSVYGLVTVLLVFRFGKNLWLIRDKVRLGPKLAYENATLVLIPDDALPHTFLNYIFVNRDAYENGTIEAELYTHERTHVTQKHSFDILFIELLKTFLWFNPLLPLYKKAIQLNHEFLADQSVVATGSDIRKYQNLLLKKSAATHTFSLASNLNFPITKKRFLMMTKTTSPANALLKTLALIPVFGIAIFYGCTQTVAQQKTAPVAEQQSQTVSNADYYKDTVFEITAKNGTVSNKKFAELTENQKELLPERIQTEKKAPTQQQLNDWKKNTNYAIWIDDSKIPNSELTNYKPAQFVHFTGSFIHKNARSKTRPQDHQFTLYTAKGFEKIFNNPTYPKVILWQMDENPPPPPPKYDRQLTIVGSEKIEMHEMQADVLEPNEMPSQPGFPGGMAEFQNYVMVNVKATANSKPETIIATFVVQADGTLINVDIKKANSPEMAKKVKAVLEASPKWTPGKVDGKPVNVQLHLPIKIQSKN